MKKTVAIIISVLMLLAFAACTEETKDVSSNVSSFDSSDISSIVSETESGSTEVSDTTASLESVESVESLEPVPSEDASSSSVSSNNASSTPSVSSKPEDSSNHPVSSEPSDSNALTQRELSAILTEINKATDGEKMQSVINATITTTTFNVPLPMSIVMTTAADGVTSYSKVTVSGLGRNTETVTYYADGKLYTITIENGVATGSYVLATYEEAAGGLGLGIDEELVTGASVTRNPDGSITLWDEMKEEHIEQMEGVFTSFMGSETTSESSYFGATFEANGRIREINFKAAFTGAMDLGGTSLPVKYDIEAVIIIEKYGNDASVTVPVPDNLDSYPEADTVE